MAEDEEPREEAEGDALLRIERATTPDLRSYGPHFNGAQVPGRLPVAGAHNWVQLGPTNAGGRVRALAIDPLVPTTLYAGTAGGGLYRTTDEGQSWTALWHDQPSLAIGALAIGVAGDGTRHVWIGTGEKERVDGAGVFRLRVPPAAPEVLDWVGTLAQMAPVPPQPVAIEAAAVDPTNPEHAWFVGPAGVFRVVAGVWTRFLAGQSFSDVKFIQPSAAGVYVVLACAQSERGDLIRVPAPVAAVADDLALPANRAQPLAASANAHNARLAVAPSTAAIATDRIYVAHTGADGKLLSLRRSDAPSATWSARVWTALTVTVTPAMGDSQGDYALALAVDPADRAHVAIGMIDVFASHDSGAHWVRAMDWTRFDHGDRGHHADHHALAFTAAPPLRLWAAHDGGVSVTARFLDPATGAPPTSPAAFRWRRRINGMVIGQAYDLTQHPGAADVHGAAFQDVGGWYTGGGAISRYILGGDGMAIGFDPTDPYHYLLSWQGRDDSLQGFVDLHFGGKPDFNQTRIDPYVPPPATPPRPLRFVRTRERGVVAERRLTSGIATGDRAAFEDSIVHPEQPHQLITLRERRLYYTNDGENWQVGRVGNRIELVLNVRHDAAIGAGPRIGGGILRVAGGAAATKLGLVPGPRSELRHFAGGAATGFEQEYTVRVLSAIAPAFGGAPVHDGIVAGDAVDLVLEIFDGARAAPTVAAPPAAQVNHWRRPFTVTFQAADTDLMAAIDRLDGAIRAAAGALQAAITADGSRAAVEARALPAFSTNPREVELATRATGAGVSIEIDAASTAAAKLRVAPGVYRGTATRPATVTLQCPRFANLDAPDPVPAALAAGDTLVVRTRNGAAGEPAIPPAATYTFAAFPAPASDAQSWDNWALQQQIPGALGLRLQDTLDAAPLRVEVSARATNVRQWIRLRANGAILRTIDVPAVPASTARPGMSAGQPISGAAAFFVDLIPRKRGRYDLHGAAGATTHLIIRLNNTPVIERDVAFAPAVFPGGLDNVTVADAARTIAAALAGVDIEVSIERDVTAGAPTEAAYLRSDPTSIWVAGTGGTLFRTLPGPAGAALAWEEVPAVRTPRLGWTHQIEAIAVETRTRALIGIDGFDFDAPVWRVDGAAIAPLGTGLKRGDVSLQYDRTDFAMRIYALEHDPADPRTVYAATDLGVMRTVDGGAHWQPFSEGLPNSISTDLAFDAHTRTLRVALWGRGIWQRHVGARPPVDRALYLRANLRDPGRRPAPHGPDVFARTPTPTVLVRSPDIKITGAIPTDLGTIDAVEMDEVLIHEAPWPGLASKVMVQAHNGGAFEAVNVRVVALWIDATTGPLPPVPAALWTALSAAAAVPAAAAAPWQMLGVHAIGAIGPGAAQVVVFDKAWTAPELDGVRRIALLAITSHGPEAAGDREIAGLIIDEPRVAVRISDVAAPDDAARVCLVSAGTTTFHAFDVGLPAAAASNLGFGPAPGSRYVRSNAAPFNLTGRSLVIETEEIVAAVPQLRRMTFTFDDAGFVALGAVTAVELRGHLARELAKLDALIKVMPGRSELVIRAAPVDRGRRGDGFAWGLADVVLVAAGTAPDDALFAPLAQLGAAPLPAAGPKRVVVRVFNEGDLGSSPATVRVAWADPGAPAPAWTPVGANFPLPAMAAGASQLATADGAVGPAPGNAAVLAATVAPAGAPAPALPTTWDDLRARVARDRTLAVRTVAFA